MPRPLAFALLVALVLPAVAGAITYQSGPAPGASLAGVATWRWDKPTGPLTNDLDGQIRAEVEAAFKKKGLRQVGDGEAADVLVLYNIGVGQQIVFDIKWEIGPYASWWAVPDSMENYTGGIFLVVADPATEKAIWSGLAIAKGNNPQSFQVMRKKAPGIARKLAERYPK